MKTKLAVTLGMLASSPLAVHGATTVVGMNSITFSGTGIEATDFPANDENNLINGAGLSAPVTLANLATVTHAEPTTTNCWTTVDPGAGGGDYYAQTIGTVVFDIVFDGTYSVDQFASWGYGWGGPNNNNIKTISLDYGVGNFTGGSLTGINIARPSNYLAGVVSFTPFTADRVRLTVTDNHFGTAGSAGGDRVSLAEFRFTGDVIPEPSVALLGGVSLLGLLRRRR